MNPDRTRLGALLRKRLWSLRLRLLGAGLLETGLWGGVWMAAVLMAAALAENPLGWRRWIYIVTALAGFLALADRSILRPLLRLGGRAGLCRLLDRRLDAQHLLVAAEESLRKPERWFAASRLSATLVQRTRDGALDILMTGHDPAAGRAIRKFAQRILVPIILLSVFWPVTRYAVFEGVHRVSYTAAPSRQPSAGLYLQTSIDEIQAGATLNLEAWDFGTPNGVVCGQVRGRYGQWRDLPAVADTLAHAEGYRIYRTEVEVTESLFCRFTRDGMVTQERHVEVYFPPQLLDLGLEVHPPSYTGLARERYTRVPPRLEVPQGAELHLAGHVNHGLRRGAVLTSRGDSIPMVCTGDSIFSVLKADSNLNWRPWLQDDRGLIDTGDLEYAVTLRLDQSPTAELSSSVQSGLLPADGRIPLQCRVRDDYGLSGVDLQMARGEEFKADSELPWFGIDVLDRSADRRTIQSELGEVILVAGSRETSTGELRMDLQLLADALDLVPGESLLLRLEARDNRRPGPAGVGRSRVLRFLLPSAVDIMGDQLAGQDDRLESLKDLRRQAEHLATDLERINREMMKNPDPDFARQQEALAAVARQQELQQELSRMAEDLRQDVDQVASRGMMSMEMLEKMEQIGQLMEELQSDELRRMQEMMRSAMDELTPQQIAEAVREVARNQEAYLEKMDRTIKLLEQMRQEQQLEAAASRTESLMRQQQELSEQAPTDADTADRQRELADQVDQLKEFLKELQESLADQQESRDPAADGKDDPLQSMREALEGMQKQMQEQDPAQSMREAAEQMSGPPDAAEQSQHQAMRELASLYHIVREAQQNMQMSMQQTMITGLRRLAHELLELSNRQEELTQAAPAFLDDGQAVELARRQQHVLRGAQHIRDRMREVLDGSSMISGRLLRDLDGVVAVLQNHVRYLQGGQTGPARQSARDGLERINRVVINLLTSLQSSGSGQGSGSPMPSAGEQLQRMAESQAGLNGMTEMMMQQISGQRAAAQRLDSGEMGEEQQRLADELKDLDLQSRNRSERLLGDLQEIARDAEQVAREISDGGISEETLRRQERILGRMLDARNSARRRDYSERRESRAASELFGSQSGSDGSGDVDESTNAFQRRDLPVDAVPGEYRDLVRRYFEYLRKLEEGSLEVQP